MVRGQKRHSRIKTTLKLRVTDRMKQLSVRQEKRRVITVKLQQEESRLC